MNLLAMKNHMMQVRISSLGALCRIFNTDADNVRCLLSHFINKGCVRKCTKKPACGSKCFNCPVADVEIYEWLEPVKG